MTLCVRLLKDVQYLRENNRITSEIGHPKKKLKILFLRLFISCLIILSHNLLAKLYPLQLTNNNV